ncbi:LysR family transcriptional regulator [Klebsiella quasipneumoniae]|uniref:LysR family transcriptional regulator n=1 Tax=Klebsiella quasipneumoniae TaxID=1463165 RepID=UPI000DC7576F|nr:LysR family transcriptional regulator [Klebsiella quasipneumoniae]AWX86716.1 LysR family transcriptional regulator [Klebsiella quasipneumoniae subsp. quasipneumoniae]MCS6402232.1 LysR family transcriptional regulator [Klebsiella quasipneumoniae subsp. quasipneumoniae]QEY77727.1 LysR family transcriptional regulator [Klebsiella quasipneumoniae]HBQ2880801.1 LysR family transcriptional regulator [Klebsiella quasipneumoniae subsp. quasipneumoniae]HBR1493263.1 LysR family transcriptional regulat
MFRLEDLTLFVRAAALGSFSDAAREAGQQPAQVSAAIKRLETILNIRLFARSTRSLRLTPEGETWLPYATQMLDTLEAGLQKIQIPDDEIRGMLQIAVPSDLGRNLLLTLFRDFRQRHPALRLRLLFSDQLTDVFKDPVDVAFRYGNNDDASFISLPVAPENRRVLVASPEWIARHGEPQTLEELGQHNALIYILRGRPFDRWSLSLDGEVLQQKVSGTVMSDDAEVIRRLAVAGEGIAYKSMLDVSDDLRAGRLRRLLPRYQGDVVPLNLICPHRKQLSAAVRLLYEEVKSHCEGLNV